MRRIHFSLGSRILETSLTLPGLTIFVVAFCCVSVEAVKSAKDATGWKVVDVCESVDCQNGGVCEARCSPNHESQTEARCRCPVGWQGPKCQCKSPVPDFMTPNDVLFIIDGSFSLGHFQGYHDIKNRDQAYKMRDEKGEKVFKAAKEFIISIITSMAFKYQQESRIGFIQFGGNRKPIDWKHKMSFNQTSKMSKAEICSRIRSTPWLRDNSIPEKALEEAYNDFRTEGRHSFMGVPVHKYIVIITDAKFTNREDAEKIKVILKRLPDVKEIVVGIGWSVDPAALLVIANEDSDRVHSVKEDLTKLNDQLKFKILDFEMNHA